MPQTFQDDSTKINFALSYLRDVALEWFEQGISGETEEIPDWINDWDLFIKKLQLTLALMMKLVMLSKNWLTYA